MKWNALGLVLEIGVIKAFFGINQSWLMYVSWWWVGRKGSEMSPTFFEMHSGLEIWLMVACDEMEMLNMELGRKDWIMGEGN